MNLLRGRGAFKPLSLLLVVLVAFANLPRVNGETGLPNLSTVTDTASTSSSTTSSTTSTDSTSTDSTTSTSTTSATTTFGASTSSATSTATGTTTYPTATVPPTADAPYMQASNLPEGTVFIAVGAALGFIGLSVLVWRGMVAWSVNRSVRRAAYEQAKSDNQALLRRSSRRKSQRRRRSRRGTRGTSMGLEKLSKSDHQSNLSTVTPANQSSLFFSPTAAPGSNVSVNNRASTFLPAGYYAAGNTGIGNQSQVNLGRSPPGTPTSPPSRGFEMPFNNRSSHHMAASTSSLNLNAPPQGRVPSAYLEDLFDSHTPAPPGGRDRS